MESSEASWHSFDPSVAVEDSEAMARLLGVQFFGNEQQQQKQPAAAAPLSSMYWPAHEADQYYTSAPYYMQMQEGTSASAGAGYHNHGGYYDGGAMVGEFFVAPEEQITDPAAFMVDLNLQFDDQDGNTSACRRKLGDQNGESSTGTAPKKKPRSASATTPPVQRKGKSSVPPKRASKGACSRGAQQEESNGGNNVQSSSNYLSDDDDDESLEMTSCSNMSSASKKKSSSHGAGAKARAGRGAATDPQSLYARKRREKINERLKVLQNLVPNGTKVDISTMLEEAVHYIKFMQLQIKLLSSDDMWMFAPIAYNGFNVGLDLKIAPPQQ
ncbi:uncharacterized protein [Lolium perenne]|uniref:uncharacterized protein n=2 Tax=Lolium TaxID=4520 RepID=UPI0021EA7858